VLHNNTHAHHVSAVHEERLRDSADRRRETDLRRTVAAAQRGDQSAWSALFQRFRGQALRVARFHGLDADQADDVIQETWLRLYRSIGAVREPAALGAWVRTTARRESLRALGAHAREVLTDDEERFEPMIPDDLDDDVSPERRAAVRQALAKLPESQRRLMEALLADPAPSYADVSAQLGIPIGSIGPTRGRCIERLCREMSERGAAPA
jgi:RNA polymerase sigma factor (sigma-70 family)